MSRAALITPEIQRRRQQRIEAIVSRERQNAEAISFGRRHGWVMTSRHKGFGVLTLSRGCVRVISPKWGGWDRDTNHRAFNHPYFYRWRNQRAAAIVSHPYHCDVEMRQSCREFAMANGLKVEFPDELSWWVPGDTTLVLWTRADV